MTPKPVAFSLAMVVALAACSADGGGGDPTRPQGTDATGTSRPAPAATPAPSAALPAVGCDGTPAVGGTAVTCSAPGWPDRQFDVYLPGSYDPTVPTPLVIAFHGGGGWRQSAAMTSCAGGDLTAGNCLHAVGERHGFITVYPDGTANPPSRRIRTWNAGGGDGGLNCASGYACREGIDDVSFVEDLLAAVADVYRIDPDRVYATGLSNGGAMSHRVGCELSDRFAAIASVGGGNQLGAAGGCFPSRPVSVLEIHGTDDPCWAYAGGVEHCAPGETGVKVGAAETIAIWVSALGCDTEPAMEDLPDPAADGTTTTAFTYTGCEDGVEVQFLSVDGGGHTWPGGHRFSLQAGRVSRDFDASEVIWEFFAEHPRA